MKKLETLTLGCHIRECVANALQMALDIDDEVQFDFNEQTYSVLPTDSIETAKARAVGVLGHPILSAEEESRQAGERLDKMARDSAEAIAAAGVATEKEMRDSKVPRIETSVQLSAYIAALADRPHDYGTCVYAMSLAAVAAFNYISHKLGVTGFQASCADLDILRRTRHMEGPFMILKAEDLLYPQYDLREKVEEFIDKNRDWCAEEARKKLAEGGTAHPNVRAHWESLAGAVRRR